MVEVSLMPVFIFLIPYIHNEASAKSPVIDDCINPKPVCPVNEVPGCRDPCPPETCITLYVAFDCVANQTCVEGCFCKPGYLRTTTNGTCVPPDQCLPLECVNDPNAKKGCGNRCGQTCSDYKDKSKVCALGQCKKDGCECKRGFIYDENVDRCVKPAECTKQCTKPHERYTSCYLGECIPKTCEDLGKPLACPAIVEPCAGGCICEEGYVSDSKGNCIDVKTCPSCGGDPNAVSGCGNPCGKTCDSFNKKDLVCPQYCETNGCDCRKGFLLNTVTKKCTPIKDCPKPPRICPKNEQLGCRNPCPPETCMTLYAAFRCIDNQTCVEGCFCNPGYLRTTTNGTCVPRDQCLPLECVNDPNAKKGCGNRCGQTCDDYQEKSKICATIPCKKDGCECKDGFIYDKNIDRCVKPDECTVTCNKPNERYIDCYAGQCSPKTCDDLGKPIPCPFIVGPCPGGCICNEGHLRDSNGVCIKQEKCPPRPCGSNQTWATTCNGLCPYSFCPRNDKPLPPCEPLLPCYPGCQCKLNYRLNATRNCILAPECPPVKCTRQNEVWDSCPSTCLAENCEDINHQPTTCNTLIWLCSPRCVCAKGYFRNKDGLCISAAKCPPICTNPNEEYTDCLAGQCKAKTCDELLKPAPCPKVKPPCKGGCICIDGCVRDTNGVCIKKESCPPKCGSNEEYYCGTSCPEASCNDPEPPICINKKCKLACFCKNGFVRDAKNKCIPLNKCPSPCKGPHEKYISCPAGQCNPKTCDNLVNPAPCPRIIPPCPGGCICEKGHLRASNGICIKRNKCPQLACNANQTYVSCNANCPDKYCPENDQPQPVCDPPRNCPPGCSCKINYRLNKCGKCILASECPAINCTRQNEVYNSCPSDCLAENCEDADTAPAVCNTLLLNCQPKCICKKGHFRNKDGLCIPAKECPPKCGSNEEFYCGTSCPEATCNDPKPPICINKQCKLACYCKKGFVKDANNKCIPLNKCPSVCKDPNAQWKNCTDLCPGTCQNTRPVCLISSDCTPGCQCNEGYVLSKPHGKCVKIEDCADYAECGANQTFVSCTFRCPQVMCPESDLTILCKPPRDCPGGCGCKPNYRYNADEECILGSECPPVECTRENEEWAPCRSDYDWERCEDRFNTPPIVPADHEYCNPRCTCKQGYYKINYDECVPESECPPIF